MYLHVHVIAATCLKLHNIKQLVNCKARVQNLSRLFETYRNSKPVTITLKHIINSMQMNEQCCNKVERRELTLPTQLHHPIASFVTTAFPIAITKTPSLRHLACSYCAWCQLLDNTKFDIFFWIVSWRIVMHFAPCEQISVAARIFNK